MRFAKTLAAAAAISVSAVAANAGGLNAAAPEAVVAAPMVVDAPAPTGSIKPGYIVLGLLAALVAASGSF